MKTLSIALDWTPNINHIGIFIAKELGYYKEFGIQLNIINPISDNYQSTPGKKLELNIADFAIAPFETVISLNNKKNQVDATAVYAILQEDISSIASLKSSNLKSPKSLVGKTYASYKARYEDHIVNKMISNDGGEGNMNIIYPDKLGIWNTLLEGKADATWIFNNWEGIEATTKGIELTTFSMGDYDIPYGYSPIIIAKKSNIEKNKLDYRNFIKATQKGYLYAVEYKSKSVDILKNHLTEYDKNNIDIMATLNATAPYFSNEKSYGFMKEKRVESFLKWLVDNNLEDKKILSQDLFTNELL